MSPEERSPEDFAALHTSIMHAVEYSEEVQEILSYLFPHSEQYDYILKSLSRGVRKFVSRLSALSGPAEAGGSPGTGPQAELRRSTGRATFTAVDEDEIETYLRKQFGDADWLND